MSARRCGFEHFALTDTKLSIINCSLSIAIAPRCCGIGHFASTNGTATDNGQPQAASTTMERAINNRPYTYIAPKTYNSRNVPVAAVLFKPLNSAGYLTRAQAPCANIYASRCAGYNSLNPFYIRLKHSVTASVRVRNLNTEGNTLIAHFTFRHLLHLL